MNDTRLTQLVSSRICHDLISPVGAIGNGVELLRDLGPGDEEVALIGDCAAAAAGTLNFLRLAFGAKEAEEAVSLEDARAISAAFFARRKVKLDWAGAPEALPMAALRPALLLAMTAAEALPMGGVMRLETLRAAPLLIAWRVEGRVRPRGDSAALLSEEPDCAELSPGQVHIALLWRAAAEAGAKPHPPEGDLYIVR